MALYQKHILGIDFTTVSMEDSPDMIYVWVQIMLRPYGGFKKGQILVKNPAWNFFKFVKPFLH